MQHRTACRSKGESAEDVATAYGFIHGRASPRKERECNTEITEKRAEDGACRTKVMRLFKREKHLGQSMSEISLLGFVQKVVGGAPGERHDRQGRILIRIRHQRRAIGDEQVLHVVCLAVSVEHGGFRVSAHARGAYFMNNL